MSLIIGKTLGALLVGGFCAAALSGVVTVQSFLYIKLFPQDASGVKAMVGAVWMLDATHSLLVYASIWIYLITNYGDESKIDMISVPLALTGLIAAILTFIVHCFFSHRIHKLSPRKWPFTTLIMVLSLFRLCCATATTAEMIRTKTFTAFKKDFKWILTTGLAASSLVDILITLFLTHLLQTMRKEIKVATSLDRVIGSVVLYTFETNGLTSAATMLSMICWLTMPDNLVFLAIHFFIGKLYANSLLATLNARRQLQRQRRHSTPVTLPSLLSQSSDSQHPSTSNFSSRAEVTPPTKVRYRTPDRGSAHLQTANQLEITVTQTVEYPVDELSSVEDLRHVSTP